MAYSCVLSAFSVLTSIDEKDFIETIKSQDPDRISIDEMVYACALRFFDVMVLYTKLYQYSYKDNQPTVIDRNLAKEYFDANPYGQYVFCTHSHAFAYRGRQVLDKHGIIKVLPDWDDLTTMCIVKPVYK